MDAAGLNVISVKCIFEFDQMCYQNIEHERGAEACESKNGATYVTSSPQLSQWQCESSSEVHPAWPLACHAGSKCGPDHSWTVELLSLKFGTQDELRFPLTSWPSILAPDTGSLVRIDPGPRCRLALVLRGVPAAGRRASWNLMIACTFETRHTLCPQAKHLLCQQARLMYHTSQSPACTLLSHGRAAVGCSSAHVKPVCAEHFGDITNVKHA